MSSGKHFLQKVHDMPGFLKNFIFHKIADGVKDETEGTDLGISKACVQAFHDYYFETIQRPGMGDYL